MPTPLESFMEALQKGRKCEEVPKRKNSTHTSNSFSSPNAEMKCELTLQNRRGDPPVSSLPAHTHTLEGVANTGAGMNCETKCEGPLTLPEAPLRAGWLVAYRDGQGILRGGCEERDYGTVHECRWDGMTWSISLTDGNAIPLSRVVSVGKTDPKGNVIAAWTVRAHGYNGAEESAR